MAVAIAALLLAPLGGCVPSPEAQPTQSPIPHATPLFSSDKEALAAATKAYAAYLKVSDEILSDGGADPDRLRAVATGRALAQLKKDFSIYSDRHWRITGSTIFDSIRLQARTAMGVTVYVCEDVSNVDVLDASGKSLVTADRDARTPFQAEMLEREHRLLLASKTWWTEYDFCN